MSYSSYHNTKGAMYFVHLHIQGVSKCMWYSEIKLNGIDMFGVYPDVTGAKACNMLEVHEALDNLQAQGIFVTEALLVPCDSTKILTADMQRVLNLA